MQKTDKLNIDNNRIKPNTIKNESKKKTASATHIFMHHKSLTKIPFTLNLSNVFVLYLHNNEIKKIENIESKNLSSLYLQSNAIERIENLEGVENLKKLYLSNNAISVVENLNHLKRLEELHISKQLLPFTSLCFDPRTVDSLGHSLRMLDISDNNIGSIKSLAPLRMLKFLDASNNKLCDSDEVCEVIKDWCNLAEVRFTGNPMCKKHRYREDIIASAYNLDVLDEKIISDASKTFIKRFEEEKLRNNYMSSSKPSVNLADFYSSLPSNYPPPLQKAVSTALIQSKLSIYNPLHEKVNFYSWNNVPKSAPLPKPILRHQKKVKPKKNVNFNPFDSSIYFQSKKTYSDIGPDRL